MLPTLRTILKESPEMISTLAQRCSLARNPMTAIRSVGLLHHPDVVALLAREPNYFMVNRKYKGQLADILYHVNPGTLYQIFPDDSDDDDDGGDFPDPDGLDPPSRRDLSGNASQGDSDGQPHVPASSGPSTG
jgi:hypothetical protein